MDDPHGGEDGGELRRDDGTTVTAQHLASVREQARRTAHAMMSGEQGVPSVLLSIVRDDDGDRGQP